jgi:hypothetical protein
MSPIPLQFAFALLIASPFLYFITTGAKTFTVPELRDAGASIGQLSFLSGAFGVLGVGLFPRPELCHPSSRTPRHRSSLHKQYVTR